MPSLLGVARGARALLVVWLAGDADDFVAAVAALGHKAAIPNAQITSVFDEDTCCDGWLSRFRLSVDEVRATRSRWGDRDGKLIVRIRDGMLRRAAFHQCCG